MLFQNVSTPHQKVKFTIPFFEPGQDFVITLTKSMW